LLKRVRGEICLSKYCLLGFLFLTYIQILLSDKIHAGIFYYQKLMNQCIEYQKKIRSDSLLNVSNLSKSGYQCNYLLNFSELLCSIVSLRYTRYESRFIRSKNIVQIILTAWLFCREVIDIWKEKHKQWKVIDAMSHDFFLNHYPQVAMLECLILIMDLLIILSYQGSLPEQIFARIKLVSMKLPYPYDRYTEKYAKKLYKKSFDDYGRLMLSSLSYFFHPYKKFYKKVEHDWHALVMKMEQWVDLDFMALNSSYNNIVDNDYNRTLLEIIDFGMKKDIKNIKKLYKKNQNNLIDILVIYYFDQIVE